jgi:hypothetical protein
MCIKVLLEKLISDESHAAHGALELDSSEKLYLSQGGLPIKIMS